MLHETLQHVVPGWQLGVPQSISVSHVSWWHVSPGAVQTPHDGLQQVLPGGQMLSPHGVHLVSAEQPSEVQSAPSGTQMPQFGSQQYSSGPHPMGPHGVVCPLHGQESQ